MADTPNMPLTDQIGQYAQLQFGPAQIAVLLEVNETELREKLADPDHPWSLAYRRGQALTEAAIRTKVISQASTGDIPSQKLFAQYVDRWRRQDVQDQRDHRRLNGGR